MYNSELYQLTFQSLLKEKTSEFDANFKNKIAFHKEVFLRFIHISSNHLILPAVFRRLINKGFSDYLHDELVEHLKEILQINFDRNNRILKQLDEICQHLDNAGIKPVFMKGAANLLDGLYVDIADRMIGDIDFLVRDEDFLPTVEIAFKLGYKTDIEIYDDIKTLKDYPRLYREDVPADLEIHRLPVIPEYANCLKPDVIFNEKKQIQDKINCYVTSNNHKLIINFIHCFLTNKGYKHKLVPLRDLYDCHLLLKKVDVEDVLFEIPEKEREKAKLYFGFCQELQNSKTSEKIIKNTEIEYFIAKHNWYLNHPKIHFFYIKFFKSKDLITNRFLKAFTNKTVFKNLLVRITKLEWWKNRLLKGLKEYFS